MTVFLGKALLEKVYVGYIISCIISLREYLAAALTLMHNIRSSLVYFLRSREYLNPKFGFADMVCNSCI